MNAEHERVPMPPPAALTLDDALALIDAARKEARRRLLTLAFTVLDEGGNPVASARDDGAQLGALSLSADKAYTAVAFGAPTSRWAESSVPGSPDWGLAGTLGGRAIVVPGGVPLYRAGRLIGAIGISGTAAPIDEECALVAVRVVGWQSE